jgi:hypothetical protein
MWLNELKIAIIEKNTDKIDNLVNNLPTLSKREDIDSAVCLLNEATRLIKSLQAESRASMLQMKKNLDFLNSATANQTAKFDIKS